MPIRQALIYAAERGLDLVEVAPRENPPVCRIMDYGKWKYQQQKKLHEVRKKQHAQEMKELRLRPKIDRHDLEVKLAKAREFLEDGHKVQFTMLFRGRERLFVDRGREIFDQILNDLSDISKVNMPLKTDSSKMTMILEPLSDLRARSGSGGNKGSASGGSGPYQKDSQQSSESPPGSAGEEGQPADIKKDLIQEGTAEGKSE